MSIWSKISRSLFGKNYRHFAMMAEDGLTQFNLQLTFQEKLNLVLSNPAALKVIALQCDLFSLGKFYVYKDNKEIEDHPLLKLLNDPNPFDNRQEFLWSYMFWLMLGSANVYVYDKDPDPLIPNRMYVLNPDKIDYPDKVKESSDKIILANKTIEEFKKEIVHYNYSDGTSFKFPYGNLLSVSDLGKTTSRLNIHSRIDALLKIIQNNEQSMDSMNINLIYSGKFMISGKTDPNNVDELPMSNDEKRDVEKKALSRKPVEAVKSMIDIKRYVEGAAAQGLDNFWLHTYFIIGSVYGIPRDVLEAYASSTYENQEKARGAHIDYTLQPKADILCGKLSTFFGLTDRGESIELSWDHLPFMQVFEAQRASVKQTKSQTLLNLLRAGVPIEEINEFLDTVFTSDETKRQLNNEQPREQ